MFSKWSSQNGVDFSYVGPDFNGSGFLYSDRQFDESPAHFTIHGFAGKFGAPHLHQMLWMTKQHFHGIQLRCLYRGPQIEQLEQLAIEGRISWRLLETNLGGKEAEILSITKPKTSRPYIKSFPFRLLDWMKGEAHEKT